MDTNTLETYCFFRYQFKDEVKRLDEIFLKDSSLSYPSVESLDSYRASALWDLYRIKLIKVALIIPFLLLLLFGCGNIFLGQFDNFAEVFLLAVSYIVVLSGIYVSFLKKFMTDINLKILRARFLVSGLSPSKHLKLNQIEGIDINAFLKTLGRNLCIHEEAHLIGCKKYQGGLL